jgi:mannose-6-phosphate isomerase-like protein (cupin superfamily)
MQHPNNHQDSIILKAGEGRTYNCGTMTAIFKADENETNNQYSISEWWLEPNSNGPGAHHHEDNDEVFYVLEGTASLLIGTEWIEATKGTFIRIPAKTTHDFKNQSDKQTGSSISSSPADSNEICPPLLTGLRKIHR